MGLPLQRAKLDLLYDVVVEGRLAAAHLLRDALEEIAAALQFDNVLVARNEKDRLHVESVYSLSHDDVWEEHAIDGTFGAFPFPEEAYSAADVLQDTNLAGHDLIRRLRVRSLLIWPVVAQGRKWYCIFASRKPRKTSNLDEELKFLDAFAHIVSRLLELRDEQRLQAQHMATDALTGLLSRAAALARLRDEIASAQRESSRVAVLYVDIDRFKWINDTYGHTIGDAVLREIGQRLKDSLRPYDVAGRIGGDEFAIVISHFASDNELAEIAVRLIGSISQRLTVDGFEVSVTASVGIAIYPNDSGSAEDVLGHADTAMYDAKRQGGGLFSFYSASSEDRVKSRRIISEGLRARRMEREFILCLQPILDARTGALARAEVLTRWLHPEMGLLPPSEYIEIARDTRLSAMLDAWVICKAMDTALQLADRGKGVVLHVNISAPSDEVIQAIAEFPKLLAAAPFTAVELHESTVASSWEESRRFIERCRALGITVGIDGFGSVGVPLPRLASLTVDFIKIGRELTAQITGRSSTPAIEIAIRTAQHFGWDVIAEGVQNDVQYKRLTEAGAQYIQGYFIAHPLTLVDFTAWRAARGGA